jgi:hypothetical protein
MIEITPDAVDAMSAMSASITFAADGDSRVQEIIAVMIPIVAIVFGIGLGMLGMYLDYRKKREFFQLHHKERLAAIDKGMEVPPLPPEFFQDPRRRRNGADNLRRGLLWLFAGVAVTIALYLQHSHWYWGLVPIAVGASRLLFYYMVGQHAPLEDESRDSKR